MNNVQVSLILVLESMLVAFPKKVESSTPNYFPVDSNLIWDYKEIQIDRKGRIDVSNEYVEDTTIDSSIQTIKNVKSTSNSTIIRNIDSIWTESQKSFLDTCTVLGTGWRCKDIYIVFDSLQSDCKDPHVCTSVRRSEDSGKHFYRYYTSYYGPSDDGSLLEVFEEDVGLIYYVKTTGINVYDHYIKDEMKLVKLNGNTFNNDSVISEIIKDPVDKIHIDESPRKSKKLWKRNLILWKGSLHDYLGKAISPKTNTVRVQKGPPK